MYDARTEGYEDAANITAAQTRTGNQRKVSFFMLIIAFKIILLL